MASYKTAFPSKFLKAEDLGATRPIGTIATVDFEDVGSGANQERKLGVTFRERTLKPLVLNLINSSTIAELAGTDDIDAWPDTRLELFAARTEFQGKRVPCIRLAEPVPVPARAAHPVSPVPPAPPASSDDDEDAIPF